MTPIYALIAIQVADAVTTYIGLRGGARETNPAVRWVLDRVGMAGWIIIKSAIVAGAAWLLWSGGQVQMIWIVAGAMALVVLNNIRVIRGQK